MSSLYSIYIYIWQTVRSGFIFAAMRFSPWTMLSATSLSRKNHLFPKRKKRCTGNDVSSAANFFLAIKWPWLVKLFADNMLNIVIKRKREFVNFLRFFSMNSNFWKFLNMLYGVSYIPEKLIPWLSKWAWFHSSYTKFKVHYGC